MKMNYFALEFQTLLAFLLITVIIIFFLRWRIIYNSKAKERLLVIEKDYDLSKFSEKPTKAFPWIIIGVILTSGCFGYLFGSVIETFTETIDSAYAKATLLTGNGNLSLLMMYMFAGIGMIFSNKIAKSKQ
jgi:hypothetical protein